MRMLTPLGDDGTHSGRVRFNALSSATPDLDLWTAFPSLNGWNCPLGVLVWSKNKFSYATDAAMYRGAHICNDP